MVFLQLYLPSPIPIVITSTVGERLLWLWIYTRKLSNVSQDCPGSWNSIFFSRFLFSGHFTPFDNQSVNSVLSTRRARSTVRKNCEQFNQIAKRIAKSRKTRSITVIRGYEQVQSNLRRLSVRFGVRWTTDILGIERYWSEKNCSRQKFKVLN